MSTYSTDEELGDLLVEAVLGARAVAVLGNHVDLSVSSSPVEEDVRVDLGDDQFFIKPDDAERLAAALTRQAARARSMPAH